MIRIRSRWRERWASASARRPARTSARTLRRSVARPPALSFLPRMPGGGYVSPHPGGCRPERVVSHRTEPLMRSRKVALVALAVLFASCADHTPTGPGPLPVPNFDNVPGLPVVRISEIHYDNAGADAGEAVEISGPAGTDVTGWRLIPYNGNGGASYTPTVTFSGAIPATCGARGVLVGAIAGLQNGAPDGIALVNAANQVIEFLS